MFSNLPNVNIRIIPSLLYKTIRSNIPISGNFYELVESGIISNGDYIFLAKTSFLNLKDTSSLLGYYNSKLFLEAMWSTYSVDVDNDASANQYAHAMCPYVSTSELADVS